MSDVVMVGGSASVVVIRDGGAIVVGISVVGTELSSVVVIRVGGGTVAVGSMLVVSGNGSFVVGGSAEYTPQTVSVHVLHVSQ